LSIQDVDLPTEIEAMFKKALPDYRDMQLNQVDLTKILEET